MEYHSFLLSLSSNATARAVGKVSVSLWSIIHSYDGIRMSTVGGDLYDKFPSPYGVIFILTLEIDFDEAFKKFRISVSLWSYIHSYSDSL